MMTEFRGMKQALQGGPDAELMQRVRNMLAELSQMLEADARGEHTQEDFDRFRERYGALSPGHPRVHAPPVDSLVRRSIAAKECHCPLANASYTNLLLHTPTLAQIGTKVLLPAGRAASAVGQAFQPDSQAGKPDLRAKQEKVGSGLIREDEHAV